jgi:hypothetical protein
MTAYPLLQILLYLSLLFAPPDATRITITGPKPAETLELRVTADGWVVTRDGTETMISLSEGRLLEKKGDKYESTDLTPHLTSAKGHDWIAAPKLTLAGLTTLEKTDTGFVFRLNDDGGPSAREYMIAYHRPAPVDPANTISLNVLGAVNKPGVYQVPKGTDLLQAIATAGGMHRLAFRSRVYVTRGPAGEKPTTSEYNVEKMIASPSASVVVLQNHDIIFVSERNL